MDSLTTFPAMIPVPLDPKVAADLSARGDMTPFYQLPPTQGRAAYEALANAVPELNDPVARVEDQVIPGPGGALPMRIYTPAGQPPFPVLLFIHGGGWVIGSRDTHDDLCRSLCHRGGALREAFRS